MLIEFRLGAATLAACAIRAAVGTWHPVVIVVALWVTWRALRRAGLVTDQGIRWIGGQVPWDDVEAMTVRAGGRLAFAHTPSPRARTELPFPLTDRAAAAVARHVPLIWEASKTPQHPHDGFYEHVEGPHRASWPQPVRLAIPVVTAQLWWWIAS